MERRSFLKQAARPIISALFERTTVDEYIATCVQASLDGADGMAISLGSLKPEFRTREHLDKAIAAFIKVGRELGVIK